MDTPVRTKFRAAPLLPLALGAFAVGTESFMVAAILPKIAADLSVSVVAAGQIITIFALAYGLSSPILATLTGGFGRRAVLILSMSIFAAGNLVAAAVPNYWSLMAARVLLAFAAGLFVPSANAVAGAMVSPEQRGRAIAIVNAGLSIAVTLGVPLGAVVGNHLGWRMTFIGVAVLAMIALGGLTLGLRRDVGANMTTSTLRERIEVLRMPGVAPSLLVTLLWAVGTYTVYTYIAPFMDQAVGIKGSEIGGILFLWGLSAAFGLAFSGHATDRAGPRRVMATVMTLSTIALSSLSIWSHLLSPHGALPFVLVSVVVWGAAHWGFWPAQQARMMAIAGLKAAPVTLSLNASSMYLGFSLGAVLGSLTVQHLSVLDVGWVGGSSVLAALALFHLISRTAEAKAKATV